ncbi:fibronectin-like [Ornithodoros turicata]|uniref:fibronectin-like n=1 Tax=Ornithodoros turicata TaxID=34597 RepID=UPI003138DE41
MKNMIRYSPSLWTMVVLAFAMWARTAQAQDGKVDPQCLPTELQYARIDPRPTRVTLSWPLFKPLPQCLKNGAEYTIQVSWIRGHGQARVEEVPISKDTYDVSGLSPYERVDINVTLHYKDENGNEHFGKITDFQTNAKVTGPTVPRNLRVTEVTEDGTKLEWEPPETPNGPLNGYQYQVCKVKSCDDRPYIQCAGSSETQKLEFLARNLERLQFYWVWVVAFNEDYVENKKVIGGYASICFKAVPPALHSVRNFQAYCTTPCTIDLTWKLPSDADDIPEAYRLEVFPIKEGASKKDDEASREVDIRASCRGEACAYSLRGLKGGVYHEVEIYPHYKDVGPFGAGGGVTGCVVRLPPPTKQIKLVNDDTLNKTEQAFEVPLDLFGDSITIANQAEWIVAQDTEIEHCERPTTWSEAHSNDTIKCYVVLPRRGDDSPLCETRGNVARCVLGSEDSKDCFTYDCNGPLRVGVKYGLKLRIRFPGGDVDSKAAFFIAGTPISGGGDRTKMSFFLIGVVIMATLMQSAGNVS